MYMDELGLTSTENWNPVLMAYVAANLRRGRFAYINLYAAHIVSRSSLNLFTFREQLRLRRKWIYQGWEDHIVWTKRITLQPWWKRHVSQLNCKRPPNDRAQTRFLELSSTCKPHFKSLQPCKHNESPCSHWEDCLRGGHVRQPSARQGQNTNLVFRMMVKTHDNDDGWN